MLSFVAFVAFLSAPPLPTKCLLTFTTLLFFSRWSCSSDRLLHIVFAFNLLTMYVTSRLICGSYLAAFIRLVSTETYLFPSHLCNFKLSICGESVLSVLLRCIPIIFVLSLLFVYWHFRSCILIEVRACGEEEINALV
jgi:hypothetical protein